MKKFKFLFFTLLLTSSALLTSCGDDDEPNAGRNPYPNEAVSTGTYYVYNNIAFNVAGRNATVIGFEANKYSMSELNVPANISFFDNSTKTYIQCTVIGIESQAFEACTDLVNVVIANGITNIGDGAFKNCYRIRQIGIPNSVTNIGDEAFFNCSGANSLTMGEQLKTIGAKAFKGCKNLKEVTIPNNVTTIGDDAFDECGLQSLTVGKSVSNIGPGSLPTTLVLYWNAKNCTSVNTPSRMIFPVICNELVLGNEVEVIQEYFMSNMQIEKLVIPISVKKKKKKAFSYCAQLEEITFGNSLKEIGENAFEYCRGFNELRFPNSLEVIGANAFTNNDPHLRKVVFGTGLRKIEDRAFYLNNALEVFVFKGNTPPEIGNAALSVERYASQTNYAYVPDASIEAYARAFGFSSASEASGWLKPLSSYNGDY